MSAVFGIGAPSRQHHRPDIEGLRAISVGAVILFHLRLGPFDGGFSGVDIFFIISGFLITSLLMREVDATGRIDLVGFWARRARRLLPNAFLVLAFVVVASALTMPFFRWRSAAADVTAALLFYANFHFAAKAVDYFQSHEQASAVLHFWSLSVEEQYYLIWPITFLAVLTLGPARRKAALLTLLVLIVSISFAVNVWTVRTNQPAAFFGLFSRVWQLGVGGLLAVTLAGVAFSPRPGVGSRLASIIGWAGIALIAYGFWRLDETMQYPGWWALLPVIGAASVIAGGALGGQDTVLARMLSVAPMRWIGARSYSLYLWHWPLIVFFGQQWQGTGGKLVLLTLIVACGALAYALVENPVRQGAMFSGGAMKTLAGAGVAGALIFALAAGLAKVPLNVLHVDPKRAQAVQLAQADRGGAYTLNCHLGYDDDVIPSHCHLPGPLPTSRRVALFGDSHAAQWFEPLKSAADEAGWAVSSLTKSGCPPMQATMYFPQRRSVFEPCDRWRERVLTWLTGPDKPEMVVMASRWTYSGWVYDTVRGSVLFGDAAYRVLNAGLVTTVRRLEAAGVKVVVLTGTPTIDADFATCIVYGRDGQCGRTRALALPSPPIERPSFTALGSRVRILDLNDAICDSGMCPSLRGEQIVFRDPDHLTAGFAMTLAPSFRALLD